MVFWTVIIEDIGICYYYDIAEILLKVALNIQNSPQDFSGVRVIPSLVLYVCFVFCCLSFCPFSFGHCVVCSSAIHGFWLPLWYIQTLLDIWYICNTRSNLNGWILFTKMYFYNTDCNPIPDPCVHGTWNRSTDSDYPFGIFKLFL